MTKFAKLVDKIIKDMEETPDSWLFDKFAAQKDGIKVWHCNGTYGIDVNGIGGVTPFSVFFGWCVPWRVKLLKATKNLQVKQLTSKISE